MNTYLFPILTGTILLLSSLFRWYIFMRHWQTRRCWRVNGPCHFQRGLVSFPTVPTHSNSFSLSPSLFSPLPCVISASSLLYHLWVLLCVNLLREPTCLIKGLCLSPRTTLHLRTHKPTRTHVINLASGIVRMRSVALSCVVWSKCSFSFPPLSLKKKMTVPPSSLHVWTSHFISLGSLTNQPLVLPKNSLWMFVRRKC